MKTRIISAIALSTLALGAIPSVQAGTVGSLTTFESGAAAKASEVNGNFSAITTAVNDNASLISELQASIEALQDAMPQKVTAMSDLVGREYCMINSFAGGAFTGDNFARVNMGTESNTLTVTSETQVTITGIGNNELELGLMVEYYDYTDGNDETFSIPGLQGSLDTYSEVDSASGTVNGLSGGVMSVTFGTTTIPFYVSKYGDVLIARDFDSSDSEEKWSSTMTAVECN